MLTKENLCYIAEKQQTLDQKILEEKNIIFNDEIANKKYLAYIVEVAEFLNEERSFKFWSNKPPSGREILLEEYVDALHFIVSIGIDIGFIFHNSNVTEKALKICQDTTTKEELFLSVFESFMAFTSKKTKKAYEQTVSTFLAISSFLSLKPNEIMIAYQKKNDVNHSRQENNY
ncbi:dUTP diphosphatase [Spiroplasma endosymbiont of Anurida maritima]|uniref:dUTP diphosphatase n=1 Tax=Spiroplasma endosymbiont of Anurida maritima TaxID=2967972 RepID=UPI0036D28EF1